MTRAEIAHQFVMAPTPEGSGVVISDMTFPGYRDQVSTSLPDMWHITNKDEAKAQVENTFKLIDRLANRYQAMARKLGYMMDDVNPNPPKEDGE